MHIQISSRRREPVQGFSFVRNENYMEVFKA